MTPSELQHLTQLAELRDKGILTPEQFEKEKAKVLQESATVIDSNEDFFTEFLSSRAMMEVFDAYDIERSKLRKSLLYKFYRRAQNFTLSVNKRIPKRSCLGESVSGAELVRLVAQEYRNSDFEVEENKNYLKVWLAGKKREKDDIDKMDLLGVIVFVSREKTWQVSGRFDADIYRSRLDTVGALCSVLVLAVVGLFFWPILICALCTAAGIFADNKKEQLQRAKKSAQAPLDDVLRHYSVSNI